MTFKEVMKKLWYLLWKDDSWRGWIFSIIVLFIFIKFIFFPVLSFATGTALPLAIVESCSMYHTGNVPSGFDAWWESSEAKYLELNITLEQFKQFKIAEGFNKGDILFISGANTEKLKVGDIIIFVASTKNPVIHRIVKIQETSEGRIFSTYGDNNRGQLSFEKEIRENQIIGKAQIRLVPYLGWIKLIFFEFQKSPEERGLCHAN